MLARLRQFRIFANTSGPWGQRPPENNGERPSSGTPGQRPQGNGGPGNPWGRPGGQKPGGPRGPGPRDPEMDEMLRQAQEHFRTMFGRGRGGGGGTGRRPRGAGLPGIGALVAIALLLWLASGFFRVEPQEHAVILTFGKWTDTRTEAGLGYALPWPVQEVRKVDVAFDRRLEIGFRDQTGPRAGTDVPGESLMVTGDENIIDIDFVVLWRINDAGKYLFQIRDPETTVKKVAESAMREIIGRTPIQRALTEARGQVEADTKALMQKMLDDYDSGAVINSVQLLKVDPPQAVVDAFDDVQRARADRERARNEAETYRNDIVPKARGEAQKLIQDAEAYKEAVTIRAQGEADRFTAVVAAYAQSKDVTQKRMYLETMQQIMQESRKLIVSEGGNGVLPYLPLDGLNAQRRAAPAAPAPATPAPRPQNASPRATE